MKTRPYPFPSEIPLLALLFAAACVAACSHPAAGSDEEGGDGSASAVAEVTLIKVARADLTETLAITGTIAALPNKDVRVSSLVPGRVAELSVAEGDRVNSGQLIARIDDRPFRDQVKQAEAAEAQAKASLENARLSLGRNEDLFTRGIAARKEVEDARTLEKVSASALLQAEASLSLATAQLARTQIHALLTGTVVKRFVSVGEQVDGTGTQPIVEVANSDEVELLGNVPAAYLGKFHPGQTIAVASDAFSDKLLSGRVVAVAPAVDPATNAGLIRIRFENRAGLLRIGMAVSARVPVARHAAALNVPPEAIYRNEQGAPRVFKVTGDSAVAAEVKLGIETPERIELLDGVREGDTVIRTGGYGLGEKARIRVQGAPGNPAKP